MLWQAWWIWVVAGFVLALIELVLPGYMFLGSAVGAVVTGIVMWLGLPPAAWIAASLANALLFLACVSVVAWVLMRWFLGVRKGQVKVWDRDINED
jgi:membrane protein implicated in regulation of membrane protease activity